MAYNVLFEVQGAQDIQRLQRVFDNEQLEQLWELSKKAGKDYQPPPWDEYWCHPSGLQMGGNDASPEDLLRADGETGSWEHVEMSSDSYWGVSLFQGKQAYRDALLSWQGYRLPAPIGVDARLAHAIIDKPGAGVSLVDVEFGWGPHQDLSFYPREDSSILLWGVNDTNDIRRNHGTMTLGVLAAESGSGGIVGIAPFLSDIKLSSVVSGDESTAPLIGYARAIVAAIVYLVTKKSGIILLEVQCLLDPNNEESGAPVEVIPLIRELIQLATAVGVTVIEPTGNYVAADREQDPNLQNLKTRFGWDWDSGAILVSAAHPHSRRPLDSAWCGEPVHCYAWGEHVVTTAAGGGYAMGYNGSSAAAAIVAGVAAVIQGLSENPLSPRQLREYLQIGTPCGDPGRPIGKMPDLRRILQEMGVHPKPAFVGGNNISGSSRAIAIHTKSLPAEEAFQEESFNPTDRRARFVYARLENLSSARSDSVLLYLWAAPARSSLLGEDWVFVSRRVLTVEDEDNRVYHVGPFWWEPPTNQPYTLLMTLGTPTVPPLDPRKFRRPSDVLDSRLLEHPIASYAKFNVVPKTPFSIRLNGLPFDRFEFELTLSCKGYTTHKEAFSQRLKLKMDRELAALLSRDGFLACADPMISVPLSEVSMTSYAFPTPPGYSGRVKLLLTESLPTPSPLTLKLRQRAPYGNTMTPIGGLQLIFPNNPST